MLCFRPNSGQKERAAAVLPRLVLLLYNTIWPVVIWYRDTREGKRPCRACLGTPQTADFVVRRNIPAAAQSCPAHARTQLTADT